MDYEWTDEEERVEDTREQELAKRRMLVETFGSQKSKMRVSKFLSLQHGREVNMHFVLAYRSVWSVY